MPKVSLTVIRYKKWLIPFAILAMALHHVPLWLNKKISFYKLMGSGKNGSFDKTPDLQQWALLLVSKNGTLPNEPLHLFGSFIHNWYKLFGCETFTLFLEPIEGHGTWDGSPVFGNLPRQTNYEGRIAVLTRATIRWKKLKYFWQHVAPVSAQMKKFPSIELSLGIGEVPWIKQATFSVWSSKEAMKSFAYANKEHAEVITKTRKQNWYSEDMFTRFKILETTGSLRGKKPFKS
ncbi:MAG TPA: spheroidene monooxygenase [Ferruginibacter sp.]|nr:spheroidene monooxygenase [Ferruginibacter sp.]